MNSERKYYEEWAEATKGALVDRRDKRVREQPEECALHQLGLRDEDKRSKKTDLLFAYICTCSSSVFEVNEPSSFFISILMPFPLMGGQANEGLYWT
jgi:hypothetical protein